MTNYHFGHLPQSSRPEDVFSSPASTMSDSDRTSSRKEKRLPSITPRKFNRFFTPRSSTGLRATSSARALSDITNSLNTRNGVQSSPIRPSNGNNLGHEDSPFITRDLKRRKLFHDGHLAPKSAIVDKNTVATLAPPASDDETSNIHTPDPSPPVTRSTSTESTSLDIRQKRFARQSVSGTLSGARISRDYGLSGQLLQLNIGSAPVSTARHNVHDIDWQDETAAFYSSSEETHLCNCVDRPDRCIPFCATGFNTNTLVAVGDEEGRVRLLESAKDGKPSFKDSYLTFRPHSNAIIDMCLTDDDSLLATASGDQTARVVDMRTQTTTYILAQHYASLKQVRFQPGVANNSILATSSRDGTVQIWDLRCKGGSSASQTVWVPLDPAERGPGASRTSIVNYGCAVGSVDNAHRDGLTRGELSGRVGDVSVTAISFLPPGREHLLLTGSEANASVKLWDLRHLHNTRRKTAVSLSTTRQPLSHSQWRHFGISSINLSTDGSRLYTLCKDNTVYAYSTNHLILGRAPEFNNEKHVRRRQPMDFHEGLGPLYGFRHRKLHATSFYVKCATRPARDGKSEMLAIGSSDGCALVFPTDERYHKPRGVVSWNEREDTESPVNDSTLNRRDSSCFPLQNTHQQDEGIHISQNGTPLIRGHDREVGSLAWTSEGELITVGDDFMVRCWREGPQARDLRVGGEQEGRRWGSGWAEVDESYDEEEV